MYFMAVLPSRHGNFDQKWPFSKKNLSIMVDFAKKMHYFSNSSFKSKDVFPD